MRHPTTTVAAVAAVWLLAACGTQPAPQPFAAKRTTTKTTTAGQPLHDPLRIPFARTTTGAVRFTNTTGITLTPRSCHAGVVDRAKGYILPDPHCTPGAIDPTMTRDTLCAKGFTTKTRRPYSSTTNGWERKIGTAYGYQTDQTYEGDHHIPLSLGGVNDVANFWAEPNSLPPANPRNPSGNPKDTIEVRLKAEVCAGHITLDEAQKAIANDWVALAVRPSSQTLASAVKEVTR